MSSSRDLVVHVASRRKERGWTQSELADRAGLSRTAISAVETGRVVPSTAAALALAAALDCRVEDLFVPPGRHRDVPDGTAWTGRSGEHRYWVAEVGGRTLRYPVEPLATGSCAHDGTTDGGRAGSPSVDPRRTLVLAGCDPAVGLLGERLARGPGVRLLPFSRSSRHALELLRTGRVHVAGLHLRDDLDGHAALVRSELGGAHRLVHVAGWTEGIALAPGLRIDSARAAISAGLRWVSREEGSGARQCLDGVLEGRSPPEGYERTATDHRGVVETIRTGWAQAGVCVQLAAEEAGLEFIAVRRESYDLCFPADLADDPRIEALVDAVRSVAYRRLVAGLPGYDAATTGAST